MLLEEFVKELALGAGNMQRLRFGQKNAWRSKTDRGDIVTEVDEACERYILDRIRQEFPDDCILSEEAGASGAGEGRVWIIDPLDGTRNFAQGMPFFCVSIGIVEDGKPVMGAVYDAMHDEMFFAERGRGAWRNAVRIHVSPEQGLEDSIVSVSWVKRKVDGRRFVRYVENVSRFTSYFRRLGSAALVMSYIACGRIDAYMQGGLNPWDVAAGLLLIEEAGGVVTDFAGQPIDLRNPDIGVVTANPKLHKLVMEQVINA